MAITNEQLAAEVTKADQRIRVLEQQLSQISGALMAARGARQQLVELQALASPVMPEMPTVLPVER